MKNPKLNSGAMGIVPKSAEKVNTFNALKRAFEAAYTAGKDYGKQILALAQAVAYSVVRKCMDPQRKTAPERDAVSDNGQNPVMVAIRRGIAADMRLLDMTTANADKATRATLDKDGDPVTETVDVEAETALAGLIEQTLSDGVDLVQEACAALLEQAEKHATAVPGWLDKPYMVQKLARRVYVSLDAVPEYKEVETTPIQEVYRAVRRAVQESRAVQTDPRNGYTYIEDLTADGLDAILYRMDKYTDIGRTDNNGLYTGDIETARDTATIIDSLSLTRRQEQVLRLRMRGESVIGIAKALNVTERAVRDTLHRLQDKCADVGMTPKGWTPESRENAVEKSIAVVQMDGNGNVIARYASVGEAGEKTGINAGSIRANVKGRRKTAGGYVWALDK